MDAILTEYKSSLSELTFNSKPLIRMLTVLAKDNSTHAYEITKIIVRKLYEAHTKQKLPVLYLIDSITKSYGGHYKKLFGGELVNIFLHVFVKVESKTKLDLFRLRQTWDQVFAKNLLNKLDHEVHRIDKQWPYPWRNSRMKGKPRTHKDLQTLSSNNLVSTAHQLVDYENDLEVEVFEEEIEFDDESYSQLALLEETLKKRKAELSELEDREKQETCSSHETDSSPVMCSSVVTKQNGHFEDHVIDSIAEIRSVQSDSSPSNVTSSDPSSSNHVTNKIDASQVESYEPNYESKCSPPTSLSSSSCQTSAVETSDKSTQFKHRRKTKNFTNQYIAANKSVAIMTRTVKTKDAWTQHEGKLLDEADELLVEDFNLWERKVNGKERDAHERHAARMLHSLYKLFKRGELCDLIVKAEGQNFSTHKLLVATFSDFFYEVLTAPNENLSFIELKGMKASVLSKLLDYFYTSQMTFDLVDVTSFVNDVIDSVKKLKVFCLYEVCAKMEESLSQGERAEDWIVRNETLIKSSQPDSDVDSEDYDGIIGTLLNHVIEDEQKDDLEKNEEIKVSIKKVPKPLTQQPAVANIKSVNEMPSGRESRRRKRKIYGDDFVEDILPGSRNTEKVKEGPPESSRKRNKQDSKPTVKIESSNSNQKSPKVKPVKNIKDQKAVLTPRRYKCEICGKAFDVQCYFKAHMAKHKRLANKS